jgi:ferredoxin-nitrite reductase
MYSHGVQRGYFMMRTKVPGGRLTPEQAEVIGEVAEEYATAPDEYGGAQQNPVWDDAFLDITTRQDIQKHWIEVEDVPDIWDRYDDVGLTTIQGCGDSARNVLGCPAAGLDDHECFDAQPVIDAVSDFFTENREYANLLRKFKMSITGCRHDCAQSQINDVGLVPARKTVDGAGDAAGEDLLRFHARVGGGSRTARGWPPRLTCSFGRVKPWSSVVPSPRRSRRSATGTTAGSAGCGTSSSRSRRGVRGGDPGGLYRRPPPAGHGPHGGLRR